MSKGPYVPDVPSGSVTMAIKALAAGNAHQEQQKMALAWIINDLCRTYDLSYRPESDRDTAFAEGKRFVGLMLLHEIKIDLNRSVDNVTKE